MRKRIGILYMLLYMSFLLMMGTEAVDALFASLLLLSIIEGIILVKRILSRGLA